MTKVHQLKTWPEFFRHIQSGNKTFEIRVNDRDFQVGDILHLQEWDPEIRTYTGKMVSRRITYMTNWFQPNGYVVMALKEMGPDE